MDRKEIGVRRQHPYASYLCTIVAIRRPVVIDPGRSGVADESSQHRERIGEKGPSGLQLVIAAILVVVAKRREDGCSWKCLRELPCQELHRLADECAIRRI